MKLNSVLKKINKDVLIGVVVGVMIVLLACFLGYCQIFGLREGMASESSDSSSKSNSSSHSDRSSHSDSSSVFSKTRSGQNVKCALLDESDCKADKKCTYENGVCGVSSDYLHTGSKNSSLASSAAPASSSSSSPSSPSSHSSAKLNKSKKN